MRSRYPLAVPAPTAAVEDFPEDELSEGGQPTEQIFLHLDDRGFVPFHPALAERFGHKAAIFAGLALYWTRHSLKNHPSRGGWFFMSIEQWKSAIGLTRTEQASVRTTLMDAGVLEEMLIGRPAVMNYRLNVPALAEALSVTGGRAELSWEFANSWFRGCKHYYKPLADIAGSIAAGLYLAYLLQRHRECIKRGQLDNGCISVTQDELTTALVLGPKVQRNARDRLRKAGLIHESGAGGAMVRINFEAVLLCLRGQVIKPLPKKGARKDDAHQPTRANVSAEPLRGLDLSGLSFAFTQLRLGLGAAEPKPLATARPNDMLLTMLAEIDELEELVDFRQVGSRASGTGVVKHSLRTPCADSHLAVQEPRLDIAPSVAVSCNLGSIVDAESCNLTTQVPAVSCKQKMPFPAIYIQGDSFNKTTTTVQSHQGEQAGSSSEISIGHKKTKEHGATLELVMPSMLKTSFHDSVRRLLEKLPPSEQQNALDEMEGASRSRLGVKSPVAWLRSVVTAVHSGNYVWAYAPLIAEERAQHAQREAAKAAQQAASLAGFIDGGKNAALSRQGVEDVNPDKQASRARLLLLRNEVASKIGKRQK